MPLLVGKTVMFKTIFLDKPYSAKVAEVDDRGVWINAGEITANIQRVAAGGGHQAIPAKQQFLSGYNLLFVPFSQIEWLAVQ